MKSYKLSVIIPVYNVEAYLTNCLNSIINQTYHDLEIIVVNDGSTDNSPSIINDFAKKDSRIIVINKENGGLSSARNAGLDIMTGNYLSFVDSDDYLALDTFEKNMPILEEYPDLDMLAFPTDFVFEDGLTKHYHEYSALRVEDYDYKTAPVLFANIPHLVWGRIYKLEVFKNIRFPKGKIYEDMYVEPEINKLVKQIGCSPYGLYYYYQRDGSIMSSKRTLESTRMRLDSMRHVYDHCYNEMSSAVAETILYEELNFLRCHVVRDLVERSEFKFIYLFEILKFLLKGNPYRFIDYRTIRYLYKRPNVMRIPGVINYSKKLKWK